MFHVEHIMPYTHAVTLAAQLMLDEEDGWTYTAVKIDTERGYVAVYDADGEYVGKL